uniref:Integrase family protein n=1 Tax=Geobacter sp. (strain M21) TaxID=443144 RepID=C6DYU6_GEOSM
MKSGIRFTDLYIKNLKPMEKDYWAREGLGFAVRVVPSGEKLWYYIYTFQGKKRYMWLGSYPAVPLAAAREACEVARAKVKAGTDPLAQKDAELEERRKAPTVADLCAEYLERHAKQFKRSWQKDEQMIKRDVLPEWGKRKARDITKRDVVLLLEKIMDRGAPIQANTTFALIRKMFNFAVERDVLEHTPCHGVKPPAPKVARDRVLSESETRSFWHNLDACCMSNETRRALKLVLVTAQRPGEVIGMHTDEIKGEWWILPGDRVKNKKSHRVYLSTLAREILAEAVAENKEKLGIPGDQEYRGFMFPSPQLAKVQPIAPQALIVAVGRALASPVLDPNFKRVLDREGKPVTVNRLEVAHFTPHDLRRTAATFMAESGEMDEVIDAVLNHAKQGVIRVYNQFKYDAQKQAALESWSRRLICITTGVKGKVIAIGSRSNSA